MIYAESRMTPRAACGSQTCCRPTGRGPGGGLAPSARTGPLTGRLAGAAVLGWAPSRASGGGCRQVACAVVREAGVSLKQC